MDPQPEALTCVLQAETLPLSSWCSSNVVVSTPHTLPVSMQPTLVIGRTLGYLRLSTHSFPTKSVFIHCPPGMACVVGTKDGSKSSHCPLHVSNLAVQKERSKTGCSQSEFSHTVSLIYGVLCAEEIRVFFLQTTHKSMDGWQPWSKYVLVNQGEPRF